MKRTYPWFEADGNGGGSANGDTGDDNHTQDSEDNDEHSDELTFEQMLEKDHPELYKQYQGHIGGLKSALDKERAGNKLGKQAATRLKELEDAEEERQRAARTELENARGDATKYQDEAATLQAENSRLVLENTVLKLAGTYKFHNPEDVISFLPGDLDVSDEDAVEKAVKKVVKDKPYLLATEDGNDDDGDDKKSKKLGSRTIEGKGLDNNREKKKLTQEEIREKQPKIRM